jgi:hypothetical protein
MSHAPTLVEGRLRDARRRFMAKPWDERRRQSQILCHKLPATIAVGLDPCSNCTKEGSAGEARLRVPPGCYGRAVQRHSPNW